MKKTVAFLVLAFFCGSLWSQPLPCDPANPKMTSTCDQACIICDIDGFTGRNTGSSAGEAPPGFCTFIVHNGRWIAFIAGSTNLKVQLSVDNCEMGSGLELAIYEGDECSNFNQISNCRGGTNPVPQGTFCRF